MIRQEAGCKLIAPIGAICLILLTILPASAGAQNIVLNEIVAANRSGSTDEYGDSSDWLELFNPSTNSISLAGLTLSDDPGNPQKWALPDQELAGGGHLLIWASGRDLQDENASHTNFKLSADGEFIGLFDQTGQAVDSLTFGPQSPDVAFGRFPDGADNFQFLSTPTPASPNRADGSVAAYRITASLPDGIYDVNQELLLATLPPGGDIHYSLDGRTPGPRSPRYSGPLTIDRNTALRVQVFSGDSARSDLLYRFYAVNDDPQLPVLALITDPANLWDSQTGIYENWQQSGRDWERPGYGVFLENGKMKFSQPLGLRIHGNSSRATEKKNLRLYFRSDYGDRDLDLKLFEDKDIERFKRLVLYAPSGDQPTGSSDFTHLHDVLSAEVHRRIGGLYSAYKPVALYLNQEYWGLYWIRERIDRYYVEENLGYSEMDLQRSQWARSDPEVIEGDAALWDEMFGFFENSNLNLQSNYQTASSRYVDIPNFTDYMIINIYSANWDWPHNNLDRVSERGAMDSRFRHIMWDTGAAWRYNYNHETLRWATRDRVMTDIKRNDETRLLWSTLILRKLLENSDYRSFFINRFADLMNTHLSRRAILTARDSLADIIRPEMNREMRRWGVTNLSDWENNLRVLTNFANRRPDIQRQQIINKFGLRGSYKLQVNPPEGAGRIQLNTLFPDKYPWAGEYFRGAHVTLTALPDPGWEFSGWSDGAQQQQPQIVFDRGGDYSIHPVFAQQAQQIEQVSMQHLAQDSVRVSARLLFPAAMELQYGLEESSFMSIKSPEVQVQHQFLLSGLSDSTTYQYRLLAFDTTGAQSAQSDSSFVTLADATPPQLLAFSAEAIASDSASIFVETDEITRIEVELAVAGEAFAIVHQDSVLRKSHNVVLAALLADTAYETRVLVRDRRGNLVVSAIESFTTPSANSTAVQPLSGKNLPTEFGLSAGGPNPFSTQLKIRIAAPDAGVIRLQIFDVLGRQVAIVHEQIPSAGHYLKNISFDSVVFRQLTNGIYFVVGRLESLHGQQQIARLRITYLR